MTLLLIALALGLVAGLVPGPFSALIASTAIEAGLAAGVEVALVPLLTETPIMLLTALFLTQLPLSVLRWVGVAGGAILLFVAVRIFYKSERLTEARSAPRAGKRRWVKPALVAVVSPNPWLFWLLVGSPLVLRAWYRSWTLGVATWAVYFTAFMSTQLLIAWLAGHGHRKMSANARRRTMQGMGAVLFMAGCVLVWQAYVGNFENVVRPQQAIERAIQGGAALGPP